MKTKIKGSSIRARLRFLEENHPGLLPAILDRLSESEAKELTGLLLAPNFYSLSLISNLDEAIARELDSANPIQVYRRLGRASAKDNLTTNHAALVRGDGPHEILARYPSVRRLYYSDGNAEYERLNEKRGVLRLSDADFTVQDNESTAGYFQQAIEMLGGESVVVEVRAVSRNCELEFSWT